MVQLDAEAQEGLAAALENLDSQEPVQPVEEYAEEAETYADEEEYEYEDDGEYEEYEADDDGDYEEYDDDETDVEEGHSVPDGRFSKVIAARNSATQEAQELREQIEQMQQQMQMMQMMRQIDGEPEEEHEYVEDDGFDRSTEMGRMQAQMHEMAVFQEQQTLEQELAVAQEEYPDVDPNVLLNAVIQQPDVDIMAVAEQYSNHIAEIEEAAISRFLAQLDLEEADFEGEDDYDEDLPPEVGYTQARQRTNTSAAGNQPQTLQQAHAALEQWLANN